MWEYFAALCGSRRLRQLAIGFVVVALGTQAAAAASGTTPTTETTTPVSWAGLNWGLGIAADFDVGGARVGNATIVNNVVRVNVEPFDQPPDAIHRTFLRMWRYYRS